MIKRFAIAFAMLLAGSSAQAQLFSGPSFFSQPAFTQLGPIVGNTLVLTDTPTGFVVTGDVQIAVAPIGAAGTLLSYTVDRPLNPAFGSGTFTTTTVLDGFSSPPPGAFGATSGNVRSEFTNFPVVSQSIIPIVLTNGAATWVSLSNTSAPFLYTSGGVNYLRQRFDLDGVYLGGPGGIWTVDVPVTTSADPVPEPATAGLVCFVVVALAARRVRR